MEIFFLAFGLCTLLGLSMGKNEVKRGNLTTDQERIVREVLWKQTTTQKAETKLLEDKRYE
jgi:hypothetical protein